MPSEICFQLGFGASAFFERQTKRFDQLGRAEHAFDVMAGAEDRERLIDAMLLIRLELLHPAVFDELDDPAWIEIDAEADAAAMLRQVFHRKPQATRTRRAEHQPIRYPWKILLGQCVAEKRVVDAKVLDCDSAFRNAGGPAGFKDVHRLIG